MESINIYNVNGQSLLSVGIGEDCVYHNELQGDEYVALRWESDEYQALPVGAYVNYNGRNFRLVEPCEPTRKTEFVYTYEPTFYATHCAWKKVQACYYEYLNSGITITNNTTTHKVSISVATSVTAREMDWSFTGNLPDALAMVLQSIYNETGLLVEFAYAEEIGNKLIELTAQGLSVYDMIEQLSEQCGKEWWVDYSQTTPVIHLATLEKTATPNAQNVDSNGVVLLNVGTDITNPSVQTNKDDYFTRFYFFGSNRNIQQSESITNSAVVNKRLTLNPKHQTEQGYTSLNHYPQGFIDINANITPDTDTNYQPTLASSEIYAKTVFLDDIYPRANYKVKEVKFANIDVEDDTGKKTGEQLPIYFVTLYDANDAQRTAIGFNDWVGENASHVMGDMVAGLVPSIAFRGGYLQGLEFELIIHKAGTTTRGVTFASDYFEIVFDQNSNPRLPNATIKPIADDDCTLFNVRMPNKYILNAYHELEAKALEYIEDAKTDKATYDITCNPIKFESVPALASLNIGYKSAIIYPNSARTDSRVIMIEKHLDIESDIKLQLGYRKTAGSIKTLQEVVTSTQDNVEKVVKTADYNRNKMIAMRTNLNAQREALENVFDPDGYFDSDKIRPMSIETQMLAVGAKSQQFAITGSSFKLPDYSSGHGIFTWTAGTLNHFTIDESGVKNWTISAGTQNLANGNLYYVYAKCGKANTSATIVAEQTQRKFDADATYYYFLIGTISSESQDADNHLWGRVLTFTYGSAQINGREITAGVIKGGAGAHSVKIDLEEGVIEGNIKLTAGDTDNASIINALVDSNSTVATASENASSAIITAGQANTKIDNLEVGATNLVSVSQLLQPSYVRRNSDNGYLIEGVSTSSDPRSWNYANAQHHVQLPAGKYFLTLWFENGTSSSTAYRVYTATGSELKTQVVGSNMGKYTFAFTLASETSIGVIVKCYSAKYKIKLEQGTIGTEWSASQADITAEIGGIEVGGRNLLSLTDTEWSNNADTASWKRYNMPNVPLANGDYMLSFDVKTSNGTDVFYAGLGETDSSRIIVERIKPTTSYTRMSVKIVNSGSYYINSVIVSNAKAYGRGNDNNTGVLYIRNIKLEKGNKATDWTPAPEDTDEYIAENGIEGTCTAQASSETFTYPINAPRFKSSYLKKGLKLKVLMTYANRKQYYASLAINGGTSKAVIWQGGTSNKPIWNADDTVEFIYNGSNWYIADEEQRLLREVYSEAIQGATSVNGGLILTKLIQCGEGNSQAGVSGVRSHDVAFWAGGSPTSANTPVRIFRNGQAFFGRLFLKGTKGNIGFNDGSGNEMWELISDNVPSDYAQHTFSLNDVSGHSTSITGTSVSNDGLWYPVGSLYTISGLSRSRGAKLTFKMSGTVSNNAGALSEVAVGIVAGTATPNPQAEISYLAMKTMAGQSSATFDSTTYTFNFPYSTTDYYYLVLFARSETAGAKINASMSVSNLVGTSVNMMTTMGKNGMLVAYNASNYFTAFMSGGSMNMQFHGATDMPGVLWAGMILKEGTKNTYYKNSEKYSTDLSCSHTSGSRTYTITHRLGTANYSAAIVPHSNVTYWVTNKNSTSFVINFSGETDFDLTIFGNN